jgi:ribonuclease HII
MTVRSKEHEKLLRTAQLLMEYDAAVRRECGVGHMAGVDEVGRGSMAGPLVAAAVILPPCRLIVGLDDSKRLSTSAREQVVQQITQHALCWSVAWVSAATIDQIGITAANMLAMRNAVQNLAIRPQLVLSDGYAIKGYGGTNRAIVRGDRTSQCIAAASCLAKVLRDHWLAYLGEELYPGYGWERNAGYATAEHRQAIRSLGPTAEHRRLFLRKECDNLYGAADTAATTRCGSAVPDQVQLPLVL